MDPVCVLLSALRGEVHIDTGLMSAGKRNPPRLQIKPLNNNHGDNLAKTIPGDVVEDVVQTLVSLEGNSTNHINDNYCTSPTHCLVNSLQLDQMSQNLVVNIKTNKYVQNTLETVNPKRSKTVNLAVSSNVVNHALSAITQGHPQKKGLSPDQCLNKIKLVKGVCCVNRCRSFPNAPNVPSAVTGQNVE